MVQRLNHDIKCLSVVEMKTVHDCFCYNFNSQIIKLLAASNLFLKLKIHVPSKEAVC